MNPEQAKSGVRWAIATFGGAIAGFIAGKGWATSEQVMGVLTSETFIQVVMALLTLTAGAWGLRTHTQANAVAVVGAIAAQPDSPVKGVVTEPTAEGRELADSILGPKVVAAGTPAAAAIARS